jgi:hypothetical protein
MRGALGQRYAGVALSAARGQALHGLGAIRAIGAM